MFVNIELSEVSNPRCFVFVQHFAYLWDVLFYDVSFDVFCVDRVSVFTHMFLTVIGDVVANQPDIFGVVIVPPKHIAFGLPSFRHNPPNNLASEMCD